MNIAVGVLIGFGVGFLTGAVMILFGALAIMTEAAYGPDGSIGSIE